MAINIKQLNRIRADALEFSTDPSDELERRLAKVSMKQWKEIRSSFPYADKRADDENYRVRNVARQFQENLRVRSEWFFRLVSFFLGIIGGVLSKYLDHFLNL